MGLLQGVLTGKLETAYRSLKYKEDSNQPYIVVPLPDYTESSKYSSGAPDFILRQGALDTTPVTSADGWASPVGKLLNILNPFTSDADGTRVPTDALRVGRFLFDDKSVAGALFTAKQNLLERTRVNAPGSGRRVYLPTSTIFQAAVSPFGFHLNKSGLDPLDLSYSEIGNDSNGYLKTTLYNEKNVSNSNGNRLVLIYKTKQIGLPTTTEAFFAQNLYDIDVTDPSYIYSYTGGPSTLGGFSKTRVRIDGTGYGDPSARTNNYSPSTLRPQDKNTYVFGNSLIESQGNRDKDSSIISKDFRQTINESVGKQVLPYTDYVYFNRTTTYVEDRPVNFPSLEEQQAAQLNPNITTVYDAVNNTSIRTINEDNASGGGIDFIGDIQQQDLIKFYFEILNNDNLSGNENWFLFFRAYLTNMSDNFKADWQSFKYIGRAESFYKYNGFSRDMSLSFTIYAHSRLEMKPLYEKLRYLIGTTAPDYSQAGYMRGVMLKATIGDYISGVPIIMNSINLKPSFDAGWDINRDGNGLAIADELYQLPKMIEVDLSFIPIHNFTPQFKENFVSGF